MSKRTPFLFFFIVLIVSTMSLPQAEALGIGPPSFELDLPIDGSNSTTVYLLSDGLEGKLIIGIENLPFRVEPSKINMNKEDNYRPVELTFYGNETLEPGIYEGKVTFIAYTGGFVASGIKIRAKINLLGEVQEIQEEEPEMSAEEEPEAETEPEYEEEPDLPDIDDLKDWAEGKQETSEEEESEEEEVESEEPESRDVDYLPYLMGLAAVAALVSVVIWLKTR